MEDVKVEDVKVEDVKVEVTPESNPVNGDESKGTDKTVEVGKSPDTPDEKPADKLFTQEDVNKIIADRLQREKRKSQDGDSDFKSKYEEVTSELDGIKLQLARAKAQAKYKIDDDVAEVFLTGADEDTVMKQAELLSTRLLPGTAGSSPKEGSNPSSGADESISFLRKVTGRQ